MFLGSCVLLTALFAAPAFCQCPYDTTTTFPPPSPQSTYEAKIVDVAFQEMVEKLPCEENQLLYQFFLSAFVVKVEDQYTVVNAISVSIETIQYKALSSSQVAGLTVNVFITPRNNIVVSLEYKDVFVQVTITARSIIITLEYSTVDSCSCASQTYDSTLVYNTADDYDDEYDYYYYYDYDNGTDYNSTDYNGTDYNVCPSNSTTTQPACSYCGDNTAAPPCDSTTPPSPGGCSSTRDDSEGDYDTYPYPPPSSGRGCGCDS